MKKTKDNWIKAFDEMFPYGHYEDSWYSCPQAEDGCADDDAGEDCNCGLEDRKNKIKAFISQVEKDAINRLNHDHEILVNTILETKNREIEDAIEKTNKRWEKKIKRLLMINH